jgi:hypothetical protein
MNLQLSLLAWSAWAPALENRAQWCAWADGLREMGSEGQPALAFVPALARRRMSRLTRMAIQAAEDCRGEQPYLPSVFASRHGEIQRSFAILQAIIQAQPLSPTDFSLSVHNTAAGLYAIQRADRSPSTTISAGIDTLEMAFIEVFAQLHAGKQLQAGEPEVLLVIADEPVPEIYGTFIAEREYPYALALRLGLVNQQALVQQQQECPILQLSNIQLDDGELPAEKMPHGLQLARLLCAGGSASWGGWSWSLL